jgi:hypothetical protein
LKHAAAVAEVDDLLTSTGLGWDAVRAEAAALRTIEIERLNRLVTTAAARANSNLRELERRRAALAERLRRAVSLRNSGVALANGISQRNPARGITPFWLSSRG